MRNTRIKICGITSVDDALAAVAAGADALGFVFYAKSPRVVSASQAAAIVRELPPFIATVGLFVNEKPEVVEEVMDSSGLDLIQLHGDETPRNCHFERRRVIKALRIKNADSLQFAGDYAVAGLLLDAWTDQLYGGSGERFDWQILKDFACEHPVILAGGLTPDNVAEAIRQVRPFAVDVSSGVELTPGKKDHEKMAEFVRQVRDI